MGEISFKLDYMYQIKIGFMNQLEISVNQLGKSINSKKKSTFI